MSAVSECPPRIIQTEADIAEGTAWLAARCPLIARLHGEIGNPPLRRRSAGFEGLVAIVAAQQLSAASAAAITRRLEALMPTCDAAAFQAVPDADLRAAGLSSPKIANLRAAAAAVLDGRLDFDALEQAEEGELRRLLTGLRGFGPWSADIYLLFCLGRADAFAPGDLALQVALGAATMRGARFTNDEAEAYAERWRPWRGVAARLLWAYYARLASSQKRKGGRAAQAPLPASSPA